MKIGFKFNESHIWSIEELSELQRIINENTFNWNNFNIGSIVYITSQSDIINHDFVVIRKDENIIVLKEE